MGRERWIGEEHPVNATGAARRAPIMPNRCDGGAHAGFAGTKRGHPVS